MCTKREATGPLAKKEREREDIPRMASAGRSAAARATGGQPRLERRGHALRTASDMNNTELDEEAGEDGSVWFPRNTPRVGVATSRRGEIAPEWAHCLMSPNGGGADSEGHDPRVRRPRRGPADDSSLPELVSFSLVPFLTTTQKRARQTLSTLLHIKVRARFFDPPSWSLFLFFLPPACSPSSSPPALL